MIIIIILLLLFFFRKEKLTSFQFGKRHERSVLHCVLKNGMEFKLYTRLSAGVKSTEDVLSSFLSVILISSLAIRSRCNLIRISTRPVKTFSQSFRVSSDAAESTLKCPKAFFENVISTKFPLVQHLPKTFNGDILCR